MRRQCATDRLSPNATRSRRSARSLVDPRPDSRCAAMQPRSPASPAHAERAGPTRARSMRQRAHREREPRPRQERAERRVSGAGPIRESDAPAASCFAGGAYPHMQGRVGEPVVAVLYQRIRRTGAAAIFRALSAHDNERVTPLLALIEHFMDTEHACSLHSHTSALRVVRSRQVLRCPLRACESSRR
jgi:hypothetical protein